MSNDAFVEEVRRLLQFPGKWGQITQDELDLYLLGGTIPARPIPMPDPDCRECDGEGRVCQCHGFALWYIGGGHRPLEKCRCVSVKNNPLVADG